MEEQVLFSLPLSRMEPIFKGWFKDVISENQRPTPPTEQTPGYLSRKEACKLLKITYPTLSYYTKSGVIKGFRMGRRILYRQSDIDDSLKLIREIKYKRGQ